MTGQITCLISTSPIERHPDTSMILETIQSVRERLPLSEILVMVDGVRPEQEHYTERYDEYKARLLGDVDQMPLVDLVVFDTFQHQANMARRALAMAATGLILYVEHDTPLIGTVPFHQIGRTLFDDTFYLVRLHHSTTIHPSHEYLMRGVEIIDGVRYMKTVQWSQRPHLARTDKYRLWVDKIAKTSRTMIEHAMYERCANSHWGEYRQAIYYPEGNTQRSGNLEGRSRSDPSYGSTQ